MTSRFLRRLSDYPADRLMQKCLRHPLNASHQVGPVSLMEVYRHAGDASITDDGKLICEAILADVLGYVRT